MSRHQPGRKRKGGREGFPRQTEQQGLRWELALASFGVFEVPWVRCQRAQGGGGREEGRGQTEQLSRAWSAMIRSLAQELHGQRQVGKGTMRPMWQKAGSKVSILEEEAEEVSGDQAGELRH